MPATLKEELDALTFKLRQFRCITSPLSRSAALQTLRNLAEKNIKSRYDQNLRNTLVSEAVGNPHEEVRVAMFDLLGQDICWIGVENAVGLVNGLGDPFAAVRASAFQWLGTTNASLDWEAQQTLFDVFAGLRDPVEEVRRAALNAIQHCIDKMRSSRTWEDIAALLEVELLQGLEDPAAAVRVAAFQWFGGALFAGGLYSHSRTDLAANCLRIVTGLEDPVAEVRTAAFQCLGKLPPNVHEDLEQHLLKLKMVERLENPVAEAHLAAVQWLTIFSRDLQEDLETLICQLRETSPLSRSAALQTLRNLAEKNIKSRYDQNLRNTLVSEAVGNPHEEVRVAMFDLLGRDICWIDDDAALELLEGLEDPAARVRVAACHFFAQKASSFFQKEQIANGLKLSLVTELEDPVAELRAAAFECLSKYPECLEESQDLETFGLKLKLVKGLEDPVAAVRACALRCLGTCASYLQKDLETHSLQVKLMKGLEDPAAAVRASALQCLGTGNVSFFWKNLNTHGLKLITGLRDPGAEVRVAAFNAIQQCMDNTGPSSSSLRQYLEANGLKLKLLEGLEDPAAAVRVNAFKWFGRAMSSYLLTDLKAYGLRIVTGLEDPVVEVRTVAFQCLGKLPPDLQEDLEQHGLKLKMVERLGDPVAEVRVAFVQWLRKLPPDLQEDLEQHGLNLKMVERLEDPVADVRAAAFQWLGQLSRNVHEYLEADELALKLVKGVEDADADVRAAAFQCSGKSPPRLCQAHDWKLKLAKGRADPIEKVRRAACEALNESRPNWELDQYILEQIKGLESLYPDVLDAACRALSGKVYLICLAKYAAEIVSILDAHSKFERAHLHASIRLLFKVPIEELQERYTWLHIAAQCGSTKVCQALLDSGLAMKSLRNAKHQTASDVARLHGHADLARLLRPGTFQTRGGSGGAIAKALDSDDVVEEVSWWFISLPGLEGNLGARHSMLKVGTGKDEYLIEGACPEKVKPEGVQRPEIEKAVQNGLFISNWAEIRDAANVQKLPNVVSCRPSGVLLATLVRHLLQQGPYHVASNNCHHTALHGYNFCAAEPLRHLPINEGHMDLASSRSCEEPPMYAGIPRDETVTLELPRHWTGEVRDGAVDLDKSSESSDEFFKVEAYLKENGGDKIPGFQIIGIKRNQNLVMLKVFRTELHKMHEQRQLRVFHSAGNSDAPDKVMKQGFKVAYSSMDFNAYGAGIYFAQDLRLPDHFSPKSEAGVKQVLLCRVAAGKSHLKKRIFEFVPGDRLSGRSEDEWQSELRKREHRQAPEGYDSCIAESREALIVYRESQVLWEYAIQYKSTRSAGNPYGALRGHLKEVPQN